MNDIELIKFRLLEDQYPFFTDEQIQKFIEVYGSTNRATYELAIIKSQDTSISVSGLTTQGTANFFKRIAQRYRPNHTGVLPNA